MNEENRTLLEKEIVTEVKRLASLAPGSEEHSTAVESLAKLYKLKLEEDRNALERIEKMNTREDEQHLRDIQMSESIKDRYIKIGIATAELVLPLMFYGVWMRRGFRFEEKGTFTSDTFRSLFRFFKPTKK